MLGKSESAVVGVLMVPGETSGNRRKDATQEVPHSCTGLPFLHFNLQSFNVTLSLARFALATLTIAGILGLLITSQVSRLELT